MQWNETLSEDKATYTSRVEMLSSSSPSNHLSSVWDNWRHLQRPEVWCCGLFVCLGFFFVWFGCLFCLFGALFALNLLYKLLSACGHWEVGNESSMKQNTPILAADWFRSTWGNGWVFIPSFGIYYRVVLLLHLQSFSSLLPQLQSSLEATAPPL